MTARFLTDGFEQISYYDGRPVKTIDPNLPYEDTKDPERPGWKKRVWHSGKHEGNMHETWEAGVSTEWPEGHEIKTYTNGKRDEKFGVRMACA